MNLHTLKDTSVLMLGKSRAFAAQEFATMMQHHAIRVTREIDADISLVVEGRMLTPYEQNSMEALYETQKYTFISIDVLEKALAASLDGDVLLMSLKLSHDTERLKSFIQNSCISDALFFKLLKMYSWGGEDFFENDDNRDVSAAFISRFYENIERNHNVQYATTGFMHLVTQAKNSKLLSAIAALEPMAFHPKIVAAIAMNPHIDVSMQRRLLQRGDAKVVEALSCNPALSEVLIAEFMCDSVLGSNVASRCRLTPELFEQFMAFSVALSANSSLTKAMQEQLLAQNKPEIQYALASNRAIDIGILHALLAENDEQIQQALYANSATPKPLLAAAYAGGKYLEELAKNENTPVEILYQLQLDSRYERAVKTNAAFGKHIQSENIGWMV